MAVVVLDFELFVAARGVNSYRDQTGQGRHPRDNFSTLFVAYVYSYRDRPGRGRHPYLGLSGNERCGLCVTRVDPFFVCICGALVDEGPANAQKTKSTWEPKSHSA